MPTVIPWTETRLPSGQRGRCGNSEEIHRILPPSVAWIQRRWGDMSALAPNLHDLLERHTLPPAYGRIHPRTLRFFALHHGLQNSSPRQAHHPEDLVGG